jgi:hypothetical protein
MATLLAMARDHAESTDWFLAGFHTDGDDLSRYELWRVMKEQVKILREDMDSSKPDDPDPEPEVTFHGKAELLAQGKAAANVPTGIVPFGKAERGKIEESSSTNIPVFSRRLTLSEARLALHKERR